MRSPSPANPGPVPAASAETAGSAAPVAAGETPPGPDELPPEPGDPRPGPDDAIPGPDDPTPVRRLSRVSLAWRAGVLVAGVVLVVRGTLIGNDVDWPFGPMSQFAFRVGHNDAIHSTFLEARTARGDVIVVPLTPHNIGIARAEIEGQQPAIIRQPVLLSSLATSYHRIHPAEPALTQLWLRDRITVLRDGRADGQRIATLVGWPDNLTPAPDLPAA